MKYILLCFFLLFSLTTAQALIRYVPADYPTIQAAIDDANPGDTIIVSAGVYVENITNKGKNLTMISTAATNLAIVESTILRGESAGGIFSFSGNENENFVLAGFTFDNQNALAGTAIIGNLSSPTLENNIIRNCRNGAIWRCNGKIRNNLIHHNANGLGSNFSGGAINECNGTIENNIIAFNQADVSGGGLFACDGLIRNNTIYGNTVANSNGTGGGLDQCLGVILNNIIWANRALNNAAAGEFEQLSNSMTPSYCCIENWPDLGTGNISADPLLADPANLDFHLDPELSSCIDAGGAVLGLAIDFENNYRPVDKVVEARGDGSKYDIGADEVYIAGLAPGPYPTIQAVIDAATDGDEIIVAPGRYLGSISFKGKNIVLKSTGPKNPVIVRETILVGGVVYKGTENESSILDGLTITGGNQGIYGNRAKGIVRNCRIINNGRSGPFESFSGRDGGIIDFDGIIEDNSIISNDNSTAASSCQTRHCDTICNYSTGDGAGLYECDGIIQRNLIAFNRTNLAGGGLSRCNGLIINNLILFNFSHPYLFENCSVNPAAGSGAGLYMCNGQIINNTVAFNLGYYGIEDGNGAYACRGTIQNCIFWDNTSEDNYFLQYTDASVQMLNSTSPTFSCIQNWNDDNNNISSSPLFIGPDKFNYDPRLTFESPCIDAGSSVTFGTDILNHPRDFDGTNEPRGDGSDVDIGAYEYSVDENLLRELLLGLRTFEGFTDAQFALLEDLSSSDTLNIGAMINLINQPKIEF